MGTSGGTSGKKHTAVEKHAQPLRQLPKRPRRFPYRLAALLGGSVLVVIALSVINLSPDLSYLDARIASGTEHGNYHDIALRLGASADNQGGELDTITTRGSVDNLQRLVAQADDCELEYALVQDGVPAPKGLELIARLPKSESVFLLGKNASNLRRFADLRGMRLGTGPEGSGTDHLARTIFGSDDFKSLGLRMEHHELAEQVELLVQGRLDLAVFVLDEDAELMRSAIARGLELAALEHLDVVARKFDFVRSGRIGAGQYDPVAVVPSQDHQVLRVDTLVVGNGCASHSETVALMSLLQDEFPTLIGHNRDRGGAAFYKESRDAQAYIAAGGPEWADLHVPWLVDIMPLGNWFYVIMGISILFNVMTSTHRFRLWRIDANREQAMQVFRELLGSTLTPAEMHKLTPTAKHRRPENLDKLDEAIAKLNRLRDRCREQENSPMVPMGQELAYRYQEEQMEVVLTAVRAFRARLSDHIEAQNAADDSQA